MTNDITKICETIINKKGQCNMKMCRQCQMAFGYNKDLPCNMASSFSALRETAGDHTAAKLSYCHKLLNNRK